MHLFLTTVLFLAYGGYSYAQNNDKIEGVVRVSGSGVSQEIHVLTDDGDKQAILCEGNLTSRVKKLAAMTVQIDGSWNLNKQGQKSCFSGTEFKILKHISGRQPLVGILAKGKEGFVVKGDDGKEIQLAEVSSGLAKLEGKKVIIDAKSVTTSAKKSLKVVSYGEHP